MTLNDLPPGNIIILVDSTETFAPQCGGSGDQQVLRGVRERVPVE